MSMFTQSNGAVKIGAALLVLVAMLLNPAGVCANCMKAPASADHHCCPKTQDDCTKLGNVCVSGKIPAVATSQQQMPVMAMEIGGPAQQIQLAAFDKTPSYRIFFIEPDRVISFHQLLV